MKHLNLRLNSTKEGNHLRKKIILFPWGFIINPLNHIFDFSHKKGYFLFNHWKTNISFSECWFFFRTRYKTSSKGIL
jgi:hypothetical protein